MEQIQTLQHAVLAYFDDNTNKIINNFIKEIAVATGNRFMLDNNLPPHMTMGIMLSENLNGDFDSLNNYLKELNHKKVDIMFRSIGIFLPTTLYLGPILDNNLIELNKKIQLLIRRAGGQIDAQYSFDTWQPHATLAMSLTDEELEKALHIIDKTKIEFSGKIEKLALTHCCPLQEISVYDLK